MRKSSYLQTLYLQKPWLLILLIAIITTLPWIGLDDFYTQKEYQEAAMATSLLNSNSWFMLGDLTHKPPLNHWLIATFSYLFNNNEISPFVLRLPSALAFIGLIGICFMFFARRRSPLEAFITCLILITCFEIHRTAMTTHLDMLLVFFIVSGMIQLYIWSESKKNVYLFSSWVFLSLAILTKGSVGLILPTLVFAVYLLIDKCKLFNVIGKCLLVIIPSLIIPFIWYYIGYKTQGEGYLNSVLSENFKYFFLSNDIQIGGQALKGEGSWWFYFISIIIGYMPQTLLLIISLFFINYSKFCKSETSTILRAWNKLIENKIFLFSFVTIIVTFIFFSILSPRHSTYILLLYPFMAFFFAQYMIYLIQNKPISVRIYTSILTAICGISIVISILCLTKVFEFNALIEPFTDNANMLSQLQLISNQFASLNIIECILIIILIYAFVHSIYLLKKQSNIKVLMASFGLIIALNMFTDQYIFAPIKSGENITNTSENKSIQFSENQVKNKYFLLDLKKL